jgi:hypothetical protein
LAVVVLITPLHDQPIKTPPSSTDRLIDATALLMVLGGIGLFAFARSALTGIGNGTRKMPEGISAVAVTQFHVAQSSIALWIVGLGVIVGIAAAVRHRVKSRTV